MSFDSNSVLWEGFLEKKGRDFFSRWHKRKMVIVGDECRYFEPDSANNVKSTIKLVSTATVTANASIVKITTVGRAEKKREANGVRDFELRITDASKRSQFIQAVNQVINNIKAAEARQADARQAEARQAEARQAEADEQSRLNAAKITANKNKQNASTREIAENNSTPTQPSNITSTSTSGATKYVSYNGSQPTIPRGPANTASSFNHHNNDFPKPKVNIYPPPVSEVSTTPSSLEATISTTDSHPHSRTSKDENTTNYRPPINHNSLDPPRSSSIKINVPTKSSSQSQRLNLKSESSLDNDAADKSVIPTIIQPVVIRRENMDLAKITTASSSTRNSITDMSAKSKSTGNTLSQQSPMKSVTEEAKASTEAKNRGSILSLSKLNSEQQLSAIMNDNQNNNTFATTTATATASTETKETGGVLTQHHHHHHPPSEDDISHTPTIVSQQLPPYGKPRNKRSSNRDRVEELKESEGEIPRHSVKSTTTTSTSSSADTTPSPPTVVPAPAQVTTTAVSQRRVWPPPSKSPMEESKQPTITSGLSTSHSLRRVDLVTEHPSKNAEPTAAAPTTATVPAPAAAQPVNSTVAELRRKLELQNKKSTKDVSITKKNTGSVPRNNGLSSLEAGARNSLPSSPTAKVDFRREGSGFGHSPKSPSATLSVSSADIANALREDETAGASSHLPPTTKKSEEDETSIASSGSRGSSSNIPVVTKSSRSGSGSGLSMLNVPLPSGRSKSPKSSLTRAEVESKRQFAKKLVEDALKSPSRPSVTNGGNGGNNKTNGSGSEGSSGNVSKDSGSLDKSESKERGSIRKRPSAINREAVAKEIHNPESSELDKSTLSPKSLSATNYMSTMDSAFNDVQLKDVRLKHTKSQRRMPPVGSKAFQLQLDQVTKGSLPSLAERKRLLVTPAAAISPRHQDKARLATVSESESPDTTKPLSLPEFAKKVEIDDIGEDDSNVTVEVIDERDFLVVARKFFEHQEAINSLWERKSENLITSIADMPFPENFPKYQIGAEGNMITGYEELYKCAKLARSFFNQAVKQAALENSIPDIEKCYESSSCIYLPGLKLIGKAADKVATFDDAEEEDGLRPGPPEAYLYDIVRGRVLCTSERQMVSFIKRIFVAPLVTVVRVKNRFTHPLPNGFRDVLLTLQVEYHEPSNAMKSSKYLCELQVTYISIYKLSLRKNRGLNKSLYELFRPYFLRNISREAISKRVALLRDFISIESFPDEVEKFNESNGYLFELAERAVASTDLEEMRATRDFFSRLEIGSAEAVLQRALVINIQNICGKSINDIRVAREIEVFAKLLMLDPAPDIVETTALYQKSIEIKKSIYGERNLSVAKSMTSLAQVLEELDDLATAKTVNLEALRIRLALLPPDHRLIGESYNNIGVVHELLGDYNDAIESYRKAITIKKTALSPQHPDLATTYTNLAIAIHQRGGEKDLTETEDMLRDALEILRRAYGDENTLVADAFVKLALLLSSIGNYIECKELLEESLKIRKVVCGEKSAPVAESYKALSNVYRLMGKFKEAKDAADSALFIYFDIDIEDKHIETASALNNLGIILDAQGKYDEAEKTFKMALKIRRKVLNEDEDDTQDIADTLVCLGGVLKEKGLLDAAEETIRKALSIYRRQNGSKTSEAECICTLASIFAARDRFEESKAMYEKALEITIQTQGRFHHYVATLQNNIAVLLKKHGDMEEAKRLYEEALALRKQLFGKDHPFVGQSLNNLAVLYKEQNRLREAKLFYEQALTIYRKAYSDEHPDVAAAYFNIAGLLYAQDPTSEQAMKNGQMAVSIAKRVLGENHPTTQKYLADWPTTTSTTTTV